MVRALDISSTVLYMPLVLLSFICVSFLAAPSVVADDNTVIDKVNVKVSASCTISGAGTNTHYAEIYNGYMKMILALRYYLLFAMTMKDLLFMPLGILGILLGKKIAIS